MVPLEKGTEESPGKLDHGPMDKAICGILGILANSLCCLHKKRIEKLLADAEGLDKGSELCGEKEERRPHVISYDESQ
jgi:hypothetical protein